MLYMSLDYKSEALIQQTEAFFMPHWSFYTEKQPAC